MPTAGVHPGASAVADYFSVSVADVEISDVTGRVPAGVRAFLATVDGMPGGPYAGAIDAEGVAFKSGPALDKLAQGWASEVPVPSDTDAAGVAAVGAAMMGHTPVLVIDPAARMPEEWRALVTPPRAASVDGHPAIEFWTRTTEEPPLVRTQIVFDPAGVQVRSVGIWALTE